MWTFKFEVIFVLGTYLHVVNINIYASLLLKNELLPPALSVGRLQTPVRCLAAIQLGVQRECKL
jgi:hypothetical protein